MEKVRAILFDTRSIQKYLFSGNKLKTNIGASYIVAHVFQDVLVDGTDNRKGILKQRYGDKLDGKSWQEKDPPASIPEGKKCYVAYIGGGNALVLLRYEIGEEECREIVKEFTSTLLTLYPGLQTGAAIGELTLSDEKDPASGGKESYFQTSFNKLHDKLKKQQNEMLVQVNPFYTGLTLSCPVNGEAANGYDVYGSSDNNEEGRFFSQEVIAKKNAAPKANEDLQKILKKVCPDKAEKYVFPEEIDKLGQKKGENDIAIIHIDGNNMGMKFNEAATTLALRSKLSAKLPCKTEASFTKLVRQIVEEYEKYRDVLAIGGDDDKEMYLPIRPLILGGDDVTFICPAKTALLYAVRFMRQMKTDEDGDPISTCGGIAILPASYPFFRGYELAEQLCGAAKAKSRDDSDSCWLDFAILHGEQAPTLEQIREREYRGLVGKNMHFGPYRVDSDETEFSLCHLLKRIQNFQKLPSNKVKELRFVLQKDTHEIHTFLEQLQHNGQNIQDAYEKDPYAKEPLWEDTNLGDGKTEKRTPWVDAIEMMDYYMDEEKFSYVLDNSGKEE